MHEGRISGLVCDDFIIKNGSGIIVSCTENTKEEFKGEYHLVVYKYEHVGKSKNRFKKLLAICLNIFDKFCLVNIDKMMARVRLFIAKNQH